jgi:GAF domain-containing protein
MLLGSGEGSDDGADRRMSIVARHGDQPAVALSVSVAHGEGIAGGVLASGAALCVADLAGSPYAHLARRAGAPGSLLCVPIRIDGAIVGVVNAANPASVSAFGDTELRMLDVVALFIGKAIQVQQLQRLLDSRFAQLALLLHTGQAGAVAPHTAYRNPEDVARILARSFFREMTKVGFEPPQIVGAASELIGQLNLQLQQEKKRKASAS